MRLSGVIMLVPGLPRLTTRVPLLCPTPPCVTSCPLHSRQFEHRFVVRGSTLFSTSPPGALRLQQPVWGPAPSSHAARSSATQRQTPRGPLTRSCLAGPPVCCVQAAWSC